jgi:hypothetical protein
VTGSDALSAGTLFRDGAGNAPNLTLPLYPDVHSLGVASNITIDTVIATVESVTSPVAAGSFKGGSVLPVVVSFSKPMYVSGVPQLLMKTGLSANF